jgi:hypothetical protein
MTQGGKLKYEEPVIRDYGALIEITRASGVVGGEDGVGKAIHVVVDPIAEATVQVLP